MLNGPLGIASVLPGYLCHVFDIIGSVRVLFLALVLCY